MSGAAMSPDTAAKPDKRAKLRKAILLGVAFAFLLVFPRIYPKSYVMGVMCRIFMYSILAGSLNVINGYSGQFNIGHAGFFCVGAYCEAILATKLGVSFWFALPLAGAFAAMIGLLVSLPTLRLRGIYLAITTLGSSEILRLVALNWEGLTGGPVGIKNIPSPILFGMKISKSIHYYYIFLALAAIFFFVTDRVIKSRVGRAWISIREDELAARSLGVETGRYKAMNFMYGAFWAGIAGAAFGPYFKFISSDMFTLDEGFNILSMVIIGGQGTLVGPVVGSVIVNFLTEFLRPISQYRLVVYALLIIVMMWIRPQGLVGASNSVLAERKRARSSHRAKAKVAATGETGGTMMEALLEARDVSLHFGGLKAVDSVSMRIESGDVFGIIGPNGAGKTTFFNICSGIYKPTSGDIYFRGERISGQTPDKIARLGLARTFQNIQLFKYMTVLENVKIGFHTRTRTGIASAILHDRRYREDEAFATRKGLEVLERVGLMEYKDTLASNLAYGLQRKVEIARALALDPKILLLDEPVAGMNPIETQSLSEFITALNDDGYTIAVIEHDMKFVMGTCSHILVLNFGQKICEGLPSEVREDKAVNEAYFGKGIVVGGGQIC